MPQAKGHLLLPFTLLFFFTSQAIGQDFAVPTAWRNPEVALSVDERIQLATGAMDLALGTAGENGLVGGDYSATAHLLYFAAQLDSLSNQTKYKGQMATSFEGAMQARPQFLDQLPWGYAALKAYETYGDQIFLDHAEMSWNSANFYTLSEEDINSGRSRVKEFELSKQCSGISMRGGTFWQTDQANGQVFGPSTGNFFVLSAYLAKVTSNSMYLDAARASETFIRSHLLNRDDRLQASVSANRADSCSTGFFGDQSNLDNTGLYIEGMSIMNTIEADQDRLGLLRRVLHVATTNASYIREDGVLSVGDGRTGSLPFVRALGNLYSSNTTYSDLRNYLKSFLGTQMNSLHQQATSGGSNIYASSWSGPPANTLDIVTQIRAISGLVSSVPLQDQEPPDSSDGGNGTDGEPEVPNDGSEEDSSGVPIGAIVGGVVGGLVVIGLLILIFLLCRRRRRHRGDEAAPGEYLSKPRRSSRRITLEAHDDQVGTAGNYGAATPYPIYTQAAHSDEPLVLARSEHHSSHGQAPRTHTTSTGYGSTSTPGTHTTSTGYGSPGTHSTSTGYGSPGTYSASTGYGSTSIPGTQSASTGYGGRAPTSGGRSSGTVSSNQQSQLSYPPSTSRTGQAPPLALHGQAPPMSEKRAAAAAALARSQQRYTEATRTSLGDSELGGSLSSRSRAEDIAASDIPTEELVRLLNQRLQADAFREEDDVDAPPPEYEAASSSDRSRRQ